MNVVTADDHLEQGVHLSARSAAIAGSVSGLVARVVTAPLDILKIRSQLSPVTTTIPKVFMDIYKNEGVLAFWKGTVPASYMYVLYGSTQFASYSIANTALSQLNAQLRGGKKMNPMLHSFLVGSFAGMSSTLISYPFDLLRTRLASQKTKNFIKLIPAARATFANDGLLGFYKGLKPSLISVTLQMGLMFQTYESLKELVRRKGSESAFVRAVDPMVGFISGIVAKIGTFPLDLIRKRLQMVDRGSGSTLEVMKQILKTQGPRGLFNGLSPALLKSGPTSAVSLWVYEYSISLLTKAQFGPV